MKRAFSQGGDERPSSSPCTSAVPFLSVYLPACLHACLSLSERVRVCFVRSKHRIANAKYQSWRSRERQEGWATRTCLAVSQTLILKLELSITLIITVCRSFRRNLASCKLSLDLIHQQICLFHSVISYL